MNNDRLQANVESESEESAVDDSGDDDNVVLPDVAGPSKRRKLNKTARKKKTEVEPDWTTTRTSVQPKVFAGFDDRQDFKVGVSHELPAGSERSCLPSCVF